MTWLDTWHVPIPVPVPVLVLVLVLVLVHMYTYVTGLDHVSPDLINFRAVRAFRGERRELYSLLTSGRPIRTGVRPFLIVHSCFSFSWIWKNTPSQFSVLSSQFSDLTSHFSVSSSQSQFRSRPLTHSLSHHAQALPWTWTLSDSQGSHFSDVEIHIIPIPST